MSEATVKAHVTRLLTTLGVTNRVQIAITVQDAGLGQPAPWKAATADSHADAHVAVMHLDP